MASCWCSSSTIMSRHRGHVAAPRCARLRSTCGSAGFWRLRNLWAAPLGVRCRSVRCVSGSALCAAPLHVRLRSPVAAPLCAQLRGTGGAATCGRLRGVRVSARCAAPQCAAPLHAAPRLGRRRCARLRSMCGPATCWRLRCRGAAPLSGSGSARLRRLRYWLAAPKWSRLRAAPRY